MEAISNHAKQAAANEQARQYSKQDLEAIVGVSMGKAYLVQRDDQDDFIMVVTDISHFNNELQTDEEEWRRPMQIHREEFNEGIAIHANFFDIEAIQNGAYVTCDEPFHEATIYNQGLSGFPRQPLAEGRNDGMYVPTSLL